MKSESNGVIVRLDNGVTPVVNQTTDYSIFQRMEGNREVTAKRACNIRKSIEKIGLIPAPIVVNERMEVVDGQGRLEAIKQLGLPVYYIIVSGLNLTDCVSMNVNSTPWQIIDYIKSYAETGNDNYVRLLRLIEAYEQLPMDVVICAATGVMQSSNNGVIREGKLTLGELFYASVDEMLEYVERFVAPMKEHGITTRTPILQSLCFCYQCKDVDNERMYDSFVKYCHMITSVSKRTDVMDALTNMYNHRRKKDRVYIDAKYQEYLDGKYRWYSLKWGRGSKKADS